MKYFHQMLEEDYDIESAKDNLLDLVVEIADEIQYEEESEMEL